jgi:hypothetical protein
MPREAKVMNSSNICNEPTCDFERIQESRSSRFNVAVRHPSKWGLLRDVLFSPPNYTIRYRILSGRMLEKTIRELDRGDCQ